MSRFEQSFAEFESVATCPRCGASFPGKDKVPVHEIRRGEPCVPKEESSFDDTTSTEASVFSWLERPKVRESYIDLKSDASIEGVYVEYGQVVIQYTSDKKAKGKTLYHFINIPWGYSFAGNYSLDDAQGVLEPYKRLTIYFDLND